MAVTVVSGKTESARIPVGSIIGWHSLTPPKGWLLCNGQEVQISTYRELFNVITNANPESPLGTVFPFGANTNGSGAAGSSHFRLPDINTSGRMPRSPSTTSPPSGANSNVGTTVAGTTHNHTFTLGITLTATANADSSHSHPNSNSSWGSVDQNAHNIVSNLGANTTNATGTNLGGGGNLGTAFRAHGHNTPASIDISAPHGSHSHNSNALSNDSASHGHAWTAAGNSYDPTPIDSTVAHLTTYYIIFADPLSVEVSET